MGIPIGLDYSWFLIFALVTWMLADSYFPSEYANWPPALYWVMGAATALLFFGSVLLHELGHAFVARRYKVPVRSITLFLFGGVAELGGDPPSAWAEFLIAIAGPLVSGMVAAFFFGLSFVATGIDPLIGLAKYLSYINFMLIAFNMIPGYPLDGGRVLRAGIWAVLGDMRRATIYAGNVGRAFGFLFIFFGMMLIFSGHLGDGMWIIFLGWFLNNAATMEVRYAEFRGKLDGHKVAHAMSDHFDLVPAELTLQQLIDDYVLVHGHRDFLVQHGGETVGAITLHEVKDVPRAEWPVRTVGQTMVPLEKLKRISPDAGLWTALQRMEREGVDEILVTKADHIAGMLSREDVAQFLGMVQELA